MLTKHPSRLQRFLLRLQEYYFEMHYIKGSQLTNPDALSRAPLSDVTAEIPEPDVTYYVYSIMSGLSISDAKHH